MKQITRARFILFILMTITISLAVKSQNNNLQKKTPITSPALTNRVNTDSLIEEKLVQLALEGPQYRGTENQNKIDEYKLKSAKSTWLNLLTLSMNYNDQTFAKSSTPGTYVYPKYFFGFNIPLGTLLSKTDVKAAKEQIKIGKNTQEQMARTIRADVLSKYRKYKNYGELIKLQIQTLDDEQAVFLQTEKNFRDGAISIEAHNTAQKKYNEEIVKKLNLEMERDLVKLDIEKMIGTNLESIIQ